MATGAAVIVVSRYQPVAGSRAALLAAMADVASLASGSEGCFGARACQSDHDSEVVVAVSRWASEDSLSAFSRSSAFLERRTQYQPLLAGPPVEEHLHPV